VRDDAHSLLARAGAIDAALRLVVTRGGRRIGILHPPKVFAPTISLATIAYAPTRVLDGVKVLLRRGDLRPNAAGVMPDAQPSRTGGRPGCGRAGQTLSVIGHSDQIARTTVRRTIQPCNSAVRSASPTTRIAVASSAVLTNHARAALRNSLHSCRALARPYRGGAGGALSGTTISCSIMLLM